MFLCFDKCRRPLYTSSIKCFDLNAAGARRAKMNAMESNRSGPFEEALYLPFTTQLHPAALTRPLTVKNKVLQQARLRRFNSQCAPRLPLSAADEQEIKEG
ncbi:hypothetical protein TNCV_1999791 [Trichonephila clavipes]|nr:hypothetical protein TNCV_1999791 [Trichonephila clavipes]